MLVASSVEGVMRVYRDDLIIIIILIMANSKWNLALALSQSILVKPYKRSLMEKWWWWEKQIVK